MKLLRQMDLGISQARELSSLGFILKMVCMNSNGLDTYKIYVMEGK